MSDWSSFSEDKELADAWREFLAENDELDEAFGQKIADFVTNLSPVKRFDKTKFSKKMAGAAQAAGDAIKGTGWPSRMGLGGQTKALRNLGTKATPEQRKNLKVQRSIASAWENSTKGINKAIRGAGAKLIQNIYSPQEGAEPPPRNLSDRLRSMVANFEKGLTENVLTEEVGGIEAQFKQLFDASQGDPKALKAVTQLANIVIGNPPSTPQEATPGTPTEPGEPGAKGSLSKEVPLSITKKQKGVKGGQGDATEMPLVMQLQNTGISQQTAQQLAKRLAKYLQQRKIPVAEAVEIIREAIEFHKMYLLTEAGPDARQRKKKKKQQRAAGQAKQAKMKADAAQRKAFMAKQQQAAPEEPAVEEPTAEEPVAADTSTTLKNVQGSIRSHLQKLLQAKDETKKKGSQYALGLQQVAKSGNPQKMIAFLSKRYTGWGGAEGLKDLSEEDWKVLLSWALKDDVVRKYAKLGYEYRQGKAQEKAKARGDLRTVGAQSTPVGKIISRFVSDNQALLDKDPKLKAIFARDEEGNAKQFQQFANYVKKALRRQLKRRGYQEKEFGNILESVLNEALLESRR